MLVTVRVHPSAPRDALEARADGTLEAWVRKPPADGRANQALAELLAKRLAVPSSSVRLLRGVSGRIKTVELPLAGWEELRSRLEPR